jgi:hypothetical protein
MTHAACQFKFAKQFTNLLQVVCCFIEAALENSLATGSYVRTCARSHLPPHYFRGDAGPRVITHAATWGKFTNTNLREQGLTL